MDGDCIVIYKSIILAKIFRRTHPTNSKIPGLVYTQRWNQEQGSFCDLLPSVNSMQVILNNFQAWYLKVAEIKLDLRNFNNTNESSIVCWWIRHPYF